MIIRHIGKYENIPRKMRRSKAFKSLSQDSKEVLNVIIKFSDRSFTESEMELACREAGIVIDEELN